jgi:hypothetical protein
MSESFAVADSVSDATDFQVGLMTGSLDLKSYRGSGKAFSLRHRDAIILFSFPKNKPNGEVIEVIDLKKAVTIIENLVSLCGNALPAPTEKDHPVHEAMKFIKLAKILMPDKSPG